MKILGIFRACFFKIFMENYFFKLTPQKYEKFDTEPLLEHWNVERNAGCARSRYTLKSF